MSSSGAVDLEDESGAPTPSSSDANDKAAGSGDQEARRKRRRPKPEPKPLTDAELQQEMEEHADMVLTVMKPVTITMILVVAVVRLITLPEPAVGDNLAFGESADSQSVGQQIGGALINALIVLVAILVATITFVILYKCRCMKLIFGWLIVASTILLCGLGGILFYLILASTNSALDYISFSFIVWNFGIVGVAAVFGHAPLKFQQGYLVCISALLAIFMTRLPEWSTFAILVIVAIYDLFSVLCPNGPLRLLVEESQRRNEAIPALIYSAAAFMMMAEPGQKAPRLNQSDSDEDGAELDVENEDDNLDSEEAARERRRQRRQRRARRAQQAASRPTAAPSPASNAATSAEAGTAGNNDQEEPPIEQIKGIKLGLGDFIFYSVLIGRAAMFDMSTVFTCFIAIVTGLFLTLLLLAVFQKALPALPISIGLGVLFYFLTRLVMLPFVIQLAEFQVLV